MRSKRNLLGGAAAPLWITGVGLMSPAGRGLRALEEALAARRSCLAPLTRSSAGSDRGWDAGRLDGTRVGGQVCDRDLLAWRGLEADDDRIVPLVGLALEEALAGAAIPGGELGLCFGTALGAVGRLEASLARPTSTAAAAGGDWTFDRLARRLEGMLDAWCAPRAGCRRSVPAAPLFSVTCVSGLCALEDAALHLEGRRARAVLCGAADTLTAFMHGGFSSLDALSATGRLAPFDAAHDGIVISEAAAFLAVEPAAAALGRGAPLHGAVVSQRLVSDAVHLTSPDEAGRGMARAIEGALRDAGVAPDELGCVTVTAAGSAIYDRMQARALRTALGERAARAVPITTWEPSIGHALAATGTLGAAFATGILAAGKAPPFFGTSSVDPECSDLRLVTGAPVPLCSPCVLALTVGFGGQNGATLIAGRSMAADIASRDGGRP